MTGQSPDDSGRSPYRKRSIRENFYRILVGDGIYALSAWLMLVVLLKLGSEQLVGIYALGVAISVPVSTLTNLGLTGGLVTDSSVRCPYGQYLALRLATAVISVLAVTAIALTVDYALQERIVVVLVAVSTAIAAVRELLLAIMKRNECMNLVGNSQCISAVAVSVAFGVTFWMTDSLPWAVVSICGARLAVLWMYDLPHAQGLVRTHEQRTVSLEWSFRPIVALAFTTAPLAVALALASFAPNIPRYILERSHGAQALGHFAAMAAVAAVGTRLMSGLGTAVTPRLAQCFAERRRAYHRLTMKLLLIGFVMGVLVILTAVLVGRTVLAIVFTPDFAAFHHEFVLLMVYLAIMFMVFMVNQALVASRAFKRVSLVNAAVCLASLAFSWWLIPPSGLRGACWTMIAISASWLALLGTVYVARVRVIADPRPAHDMVGSTH